MESVCFFLSTGFVEWFSGPCAKNHGLFESCLEITAICLRVVYQAVNQTGSFLGMLSPVWSPSTLHLKNMFSYERSARFGSLFHGYWQQMSTSRHASEDRRSCREATGDLKAWSWVEEVHSLENLKGFCRLV